jgi:hypothetical protein
MAHPSMIGVITRTLMLPAMAVGIALAVAATDALAFDETKYPDWSGQWHRPRGVSIQWDQTKPLGRGQQAPLTAEYQALFEASLADQAKGGQGEDARFTCIPPGMPRIMTIIWPAEFVILPKITYVNFENHMPRRIYTDGRSFPTNEEPSFQGYSIGLWRDTDGDGNHDTLEVETRNLKGPRTFETTGLPMHKDNQTVVKERIALDKDNPDILVNEITTIDNALTRPWTVIKKYRRERNFIWFENICAEGNAHVSIGKENYMMSADGLLMSARKNQAPPDLRYFQQNQR